MSVKLLVEQYLEFLSLKGGCPGSYESTLVKMTHCWKSHDTAQLNVYWPPLIQRTIWSLVRLSVLVSQTQKGRPIPVNI